MPLVPSEKRQDGWVSVETFQLTGHKLNLDLRVNLPERIHDIRNVRMKSDTFVFTKEARLAFMLHVTEDQDHHFYLRFARDKEDDGNIYELTVTCEFLNWRDKKFTSDDGSWRLIRHTRFKHVQDMHFDIMLKPVAKVHLFRNMYNDQDYVDCELVGSDGSVLVHAALVSEVSSSIYDTIRSLIANNILEMPPEVPSTKLEEGVDTHKPLQDANIYEDALLSFGFKKKSKRFKENKTKESSETTALVESNETTTSARKGEIVSEEMLSKALSDIRVTHTAYSEIESKKSSSLSDSKLPSDTQSPKSQISTKSELKPLTSKLSSISKKSSSGSILSPKPSTSKPPLKEKPQKRDKQMSSAQTTGIAYSDESSIVKQTDDSTFDGVSSLVEAEEASVKKVIAAFKDLESAAAAKETGLPTGRSITTVTAGKKTILQKSEETSEESSGEYVALRADCTTRPQEAKPTHTDIKDSEPLEKAIASKQFLPKEEHIKIPEPIYAVPLTEPSSDKMSDTKDKELLSKISSVATSTRPSVQRGDTLSDKEMPQEDNWVPLMNVDKATRDNIKYLRNDLWRIHMKRFTHRTLQHFKDYIYQNQLPNTEDGVKELYLLSRQYRVKDLKKLCVHKLLALSNAHNVWNYMQLAADSGNKSLGVQILKYIQEGVIEFKEVKDYEQARQ